jgi:acyl-CoA reductase-like NAD-dependent aldehyde dehydrogenase
MQLFTQFINGQPTASDHTFDVINPANGRALARVHAGNAGHVDAAVAAARAAFPAWSKTSNAQRSALCHALADALEANLPELMELITLETGKPLHGLAGVGAGMEVGGAIAWTRYTAGLQLPIEVIQDDAAARVEVHRKPLGVVASITPWNWPLLIAIWHVLPALRSGNTVLMTPSPFTPLATIRFAELAGAILPPGVINLVIGGGEVGAAIAAHPGIDKIVFTGSTPTGKKIMQAAAGSLKRLTLELGGNDAGIVLPDVAVDEVATRIFAACFHNNGQTCAALKRLYVHESQYETMCAALAGIANSVVVGDGMDAGTELGPIQNRVQFDIVCALAESARADGGRFICGGHPIDRDGFFFAPTVVADLTDGCRLVDEEPFGPIVPIIKYTDIDAVIELANRNDRGLGGSIWSNDRDRAAALAQRLECGSVWINDHGSVQPDAPFGGIKQSGLGVEFGHYGLEEYTSIQTLKITRQ